MKRKQYLGFTLIELLVTVAVLVVLLSLGLPKLHSFTANNRLTSQINQLSADLAFARSEAVKRATSVAVAASSGSTDWTGGWSVTAVSTSTQLRIAQALNVTTLTGSAASLTYRPSGRLANNATVTFKLCDSRPGGGNYGKQLSISPTGRPELTTGVNCS